MTKSSRFPQPIRSHQLKHWIAADMAVRPVRPLSPSQVRCVWRNASPQMRRFIAVWMTTGKRHPVMKELPW